MLCAGCVSRPVLYYFPAKMPTPHINPSKKMHTPHQTPPKKRSSRGSKKPSMPTPHKTASKKRSSKPNSKYLDYESDYSYYLAVAVPHICHPFPRCSRQLLHLTQAMPNRLSLRQALNLFNQNYLQALPNLEPLVSTCLEIDTVQFWLDCSTMYPVISADQK